MLTFDEFKREFEKFKKHPEEALAQVDHGSDVLRHLVRRHQYEIEGYRCRTLEEVERIAKAQGIPLHDLDYTAHIVPQSSDKCDILVKFCRARGDQL